MGLREFNIEIAEEFKKLPHHEEFSEPLLISSDPYYIQAIEETNLKVMYIGQEVNTWGNSKSEELRYDAKRLEKEYYDFFNVYHGTGKDFWKFYLSFTNDERQHILRHLIWNNALIAGKRGEKGTPEHAKELIELSIKYLTYIVNYFKPDFIIIVVGPSDPYYTVINGVLKNVNINIDGYPTSKKPLLISEDKRVFWTYHPNYLNRISSKKEILETIKTEVIKFKEREYEEVTYQKCHGTITVKVYK